MTSDLHRNRSMNIEDIETKNHILLERSSPNICKEKKKKITLNGDEKSEKNVLTVHFDDRQEQID